NELSFFCNSLQFRLLPFFAFFNSDIVEFQHSNTYELLINVIYNISIIFLFGLTQLE
ncbi:hypothetical protein C1645_772034, partial [Glomus cerebriforme]